MTGELSAVPEGVRHAGDFRQGIRVNAGQFALQMVLIFCVGLTLGTERTVLPLIGKEDFHVRSFLYVGSFVISFGLVKALINLYGGGWSERYGRKPLLIAGWLSALPIPVLLILARSWSWVILANVFLGINQGLAWSMSVNAKIDLAGGGRRGLAVGLDEAGGYGGVAIGALVTGYLAASYGLRPAPFVFGGLVILVALLMSALLVEETLPFALAEVRRHGAFPSRNVREAGNGLRLSPIFLRASYRDRTMFAINQAGATEKFVDALVWIAIPLYLSTRHLSVGHIGEVAFIYGVVWGLGQIPAGHLADLIGRKVPIAVGMFICGLGVFLFPLAGDLSAWLVAALVTGLGMALLYPNLMTAAADAYDPLWRATGLGIYRFWRDTGYALGAVFVGLIANALGLPAACFGVAAAMAVSASVVVVLMRETRPDHDRSTEGRRYD